MRTKRVTRRDVKIICKSLNLSNNLHDIIGVLTEMEEESACFRNVVLVERHKTNDETYIQAIEDLENNDHENRLKLKKIGMESVIYLGI